MQKYINAEAQCADVVSIYACVVIGNVGDGNFRPCFYKKQYLSNGQANCREISQNIANRWLFKVFMIQRKITANIFYS